MKSLDEFVQGMRDCQNGVPHEDKSPEYTEGYRAEYERQQVASQQTETGESYENF